MFTQTLILNQQYRPQEIVDWKDAVTAMFRGSVEVLVQYDEVLAHIDRHTLATFPDLRRALRQVIGTDAEALTIKVPAVVGLCRRTPRSQRRKSGVRFSKLNVCLRDGFSCQYCGLRLPMSQLNYDHVIPRSKGGRTVWENIVMACFACNQRKGSLLLEDSGMTLISTPRQPHSLPLHRLVIDRVRAPREWEPFIEQSAA